MLKDLKIPFFTVLFIFLGLSLYIRLFGPIPFYVNNITTTKDTLFTVDGKGEVSVVPDTALISFGVTKNSATVEDAKNQVNSIINKITDDLKQLGLNVKDIKNTNYSVNPEYDYNGGQQIPRGYSVTAQVEAKITPIDKANNAIDIATKDGANNVGGVQFGVDDQKQKDLEDQARKLAISDAKGKAQSISSAAGIQLGRIVNVQENSEAPHPVMMMANAKSADSGAGEPTQLNPGENKISLTVTLSYETY